MTTEMAPQKVDLVRDRLTRRTDLPGRMRSVRRSVPFVESFYGTYTHRVRSITMHELLNKSHMSVGCWCGMTINLSQHRRNRLLLEPSQGRPICATCEGRAIGSGQLGAREILGRPVMFSPREAT